MKKHILIVDDIGVNLYLLETILRGSGYEVTTAENGREALDKARENPPDLVITDILMPVMDGYTLCREWKADETLRRRPLVFYTATYTTSQDEAFALGLGADRFIVKPQEPDVLVGVCRDLLEEGYRARQVEAKPLEEEMEFFRQYNETLFQKLEKKMRDLETANRKLRTSEECYRLTFINSSDIIYSIDANLNLLSVSPSLERILDYNPQDFVGRPVADFGRRILTPESFERAMVDAALILGGRTISSAVYEFIARDGTIRYGEVSGSPLRQEDKIAGIVSVARDITENRRMQEELRESEEKFRSLFNQSIDAVFLTKPGEGVTLAANPEACRMFGYTEEELRRIGRAGVMNQGDPRLSAFLEERSRTGRFQGELSFVRKDGSLFPGEISSAIFKNRLGEPLSYFILRDITERKRAEEKLRETLESLRRALNATIQVLVAAVEIRDPYTAGHQARSAGLARAIATEMGLPQEQIDGIYVAGTIHDIGKLSIPAEILSKPTKFTNIEFALVQEHPAKGYEMLKNVSSPWPLAEIVRQHHERLDGSGYPQHLMNEDILLEARILALSDVVEAMASHRPYRPSHGLEAALEEITLKRGRCYDPDVVDACLKLFREKRHHLA